MGSFNFPGIVFEYRDSVLEHNLIFMIIISFIFTRKKEMIQIGAELRLLENCLFNLRLDVQSESNIGLRPVKALYV